MREVWKDDVSRLGICRHLVAVLARLHDEFKPPEPVGWEAEPAAYGGALGIAEEAEVDREEEVVDILRGVPQCPQGEFRMGLIGWEFNVPIEGYPCFVVECSICPMRSMVSRDLLYIVVGRGEPY
jgi:hypothetical protein